MKHMSLYTAKFALIKTVSFPAMPFLCCAFLSLVVGSLLEIKEDQVKRRSKFRMLRHNDPRGFNMVSRGGFRTETRLPSVNLAVKVFFDAFQNNFSFVEIVMAKLIC